MRRIMLIAILMSMIMSKTVLAENTNLEKEHVYVTIANLNLRSEPSTDGKIIDTVSSNTELLIIGDEDDWSIVSYKGERVYAKSDYLMPGYYGELVEYKNRWNIRLTNEEIDLLARIVQLESGDEPYKGQQAVVEVILNRVSREDFPNSLYDVLSQKKQFSTWRNRNIDAAIPSKIVIKSIYSVLYGETEILPLSTVYFSKKGENKKVEITIGEHTFCNQY